VDIKPEKTLDVRGLFCPMPIVKLSKEIGSLSSGAILEVLATDPGTLTDIPAWSRKTGNEILDTIREDKVIKFYVRKT
jgi:TusA-related sulfurtransferase